jgi:hypothetical protein
MTFYLKKSCTFKKNKYVDICDIKSCLFFPESLVFSVYIFLMHICMHILKFFSA